MSGSIQPTELGQQGSFVSQQLVTGLKASAYQSLYCQVFCQTIQRPQPLSTVSLLSLCWHLTTPLLVSGHVIQQNPTGTPAGAYLSQGVMCVAEILPATTWDWAPTLSGGAAKGWPRQEQLTWQQQLDTVKLADMLEQQP